MPRRRAPTSRAPTSRAYALENAAFLRHLARTGNAHEAARLCDATRSRFTCRRARDPGFAARWDAALVMAQADLSSAERAEGGGPSPKAVAEGARRGHRAREDSTPVLVLRRDGTVQVRRRLATAISPAAEQRFLLALAACANVRLAARAAGFSHASFYTRKRRDPGFARQWQAALAHGYERLTLALVESWSEDDDRDAWAHNAPPPMPPISANQALQLMYLHQKEARSFQEPAVLRRRRGETDEARVVRQVLIYEAWQERDRAAFRDAEAARRSRGEGPYWGEDLPDPHEPPRPVLPDLAQIPAWTRPARPPQDPTRALFGGWRIDDWRRAQEAEQGEIISERPARGKGSRGPRKKGGGSGDAKDET